MKETFAIQRRAHISLSELATSKFKQLIIIVTWLALLTQQYYV